MWTISQIKTDARIDLKKSYWLSFAVCLVVLIVTGSRSLFSFVSWAANWIGDVRNIDAIGAEITYITDIFTEAEFGIAAIVAVLAIAGLVLLIVLAVTLLFTVFVASPLSAGQRHFFSQAAEGNAEFTNMFSAFGRGRYVSTVKAMFLAGLYIFLWSLLLIVPGIYKYYQYRFVPYIISDNPSLTANGALAASRKMTDGNKLKIFLLDLSFIGWYLLGFLALVVGVLFVVPYHQAAIAKLYNHQKGEVNGR